MRDAIVEAKNKLGRQAAELIADGLKIKEWDGKKGLCPFHDEKTPSFIWCDDDKRKKGNFFYCFGCGKKLDYIDYLMMTDGVTFQEAAKLLCDKAKVEYTIVEKDPREDKLSNYRYPRETTKAGREKVEAYLAKRHITPATLDYANVRESDDGDITFEFRDLDNTLLSVKYRPSRVVKKGQSKMYFQKDADNCPALYNMQKVDITKTLVITEGEIDCLSVIEAGVTNCVSIPYGASDSRWIGFNYEWLEQFEKIVLWYDNDKAGKKAVVDVLPRLGRHRTYYVDPGEDVLGLLKSASEARKIANEKCDANNVLIACGKNDVVKLIESAKDLPSKRLKYLMDAEEIDAQNMTKITTGYKELDAKIFGNILPCFNIITGYTGCVDMDTEYFNGVAWKKISEYKEGERVLQYTSDGNAELVIPSQYHMYPCEHLWHFKTKYGIDQCISDEHDIVYITSRGNLQKKNCLDVIDMHNKGTNGFLGKFITTFNYACGDGIDLTEAEIRLMCAVICDGNFPKADKGNNYCRINIKKGRKIERLKLLLDEANIDYKIFRYNPYDEEMLTFIFKAPVITKSFGGDWYRCNREQIGIIADEILHWDGSTKGGRKGFSTTSKDTADFIQFVFSVCGLRTVVTKTDRTIDPIGIHKSADYSLSITDGRIHPTLRNHTGLQTIKKVQSVDGYKYCFSVPSGMLVLRRNGRINVTGNSGKSTVSTTMSIISPVENGYNTMVFSGELHEGQLKNWILKPFAGRNHMVVWKNPGQPDGYTVTFQAAKAIEDYYHDNIIRYSDEDDLETSSKSLLDEMEYAYKRHNAKFFLVDNLMCVDIAAVGQNSSTEWDSQKRFIKQLMKFTNKYKVNTTLIIHPKKPGQNKERNAYELHGASEIGNLCHRLFWVLQLKDDPEGYNAAIELLKDRPTAKQGSICKFYYDYPTMRLYSNQDELNRRYSWEEGCNIDYPAELIPRLVCNQKIENMEEVFG